MRMSVIVGVICVLLAGGSASAQAPDPVERAQKLHEQALKHADKKQWDVALGLWEAAEALHRDWRYPFNQAAIHYVRKHYEQAWRGLRRAQSYQLPEVRRADVKKRLLVIENKLLMNHALVELVVHPTTATVTLAGKSWARPYIRWVKDEASRLVVRAPSHSSYEAVWKHNLGQRHRLVISLKTDQQPGQLTISGGPVGASVSVDGQFVGKLPRVVGTRIKPGAHIVEVSHVGFVTLRREVIVQQGVQTMVQISLLPSGISDPALSSSEHSGLSDAIAQWSIMAVGAAFLGAAAGVHVAAIDAEDKANSYAAPRIDMPDETRWDRYAEALDGVDALEATAYVLYGAGAAAVLVGTVWMLIDDDGEPGLLPALVNNQLPGVIWRVRF